MRYFGRVYKLEIGNGEDIIVYDGFPAKNRVPAQIQFTIDQTPNAFRSYCEITIYGLNREHRKAIHDQYTSVRLTAGWLDKFGVIFNGEIENIETGREGPETMLKFFCQSSAQKWPDAYINQSFGKNTPQIDIIRAIALTFGLPVEIIGDFSDLPKAIKGRTLSQGSVSAMIDMARNFDFEWLVENERLVIARQGSIRPDAEVHKYSAVTGLIGSPEITQKGVDIEVLMNPLIRPWDQFEVEAVTGRLVFNGVYYQKLPGTNGKGTHNVVSLKHEGDFYGDSWKTTIEGIRPRVI